jgi:hypothetical protein
MIKAQCKNWSEILVSTGKISHTNILPDSQQANSTAALVKRKERHNQDAGMPWLWRGVLASRNIPTQKQTRMYMLKQLGT